MRAVDALMECLKAEGVDVVFGLPGGANLPTYDAFYDAGIRHILVRHEAGGGHAAEGYAKATGKVGVALATSGPGATNLITPICDAMMDSVPVVFITGQVRTELLGTDGFQEADTIGITMPVVKHSFMIQHPLEIPRSIHEAFHIARTGRPGPVVVDIPQDLSRADIPYEPVTDVRLPGYQPTTEGNQKQIRIAAKALANARRPIIYAGGGVVSANAGAELTELAMPHASLTAVLTELDEPGPHGADDVEIRLAAHPGAPPLPLHKGASGGELSRVMLAIEVVFAGADPVPTFVFDEVDAGVGGKAAVEVGRRLARLARSSQVIAVTHLPQVAAFADNHLVVEKSDDGLVTESGVTRLDQPARIRELSRMLAGLEDSEFGQAHAEELLAMAAHERDRDWPWEG